MLPLRPVFNTTLKVIRATRHAIMPFTQLPPKAECEDINQNIDTNKNEDGAINASDLFSLFTANIVKQDVVFTR